MNWTDLTYRTDIIFLRVPKSPELVDTHVQVKLHVYD